MNKFICGIYQNRSVQLNPWLKSLIVKCLWLTLSWNWRCFWDSNSWMLFFLHNRTERTFAFTAAGLCTFWLASSKKFLFGLTIKILLYSWMASFVFLLWRYLLKISTQESQCIKSGKGLACWKRLTPWKYLSGKMSASQLEGWVVDPQPLSELP